MYRTDTSAHGSGSVASNANTRWTPTGGWGSIAGQGLRRTLTRVLTQRSPVEDVDARCLVDYALARRATLTALRLGRVAP